ncbi:MAG TPA: hypothetical protein VHP58_03355 [Alphaproteobacteria bacterium]|nr:hypothetical protein [Alphaproteobacteria bacterium]
MMLRILIMMAALSTATQGWAQSRHESTLSKPVQNMQHFMVQVKPLDPSKTIVGVEVRTLSGQVVPPGQVPLEVEYVGQGIPLTPLSMKVSGSEIVGVIPPSVVDSYTIRVTLRWDGDKHQQRFFINRSTKKPGQR